MEIELGAIYSDVVTGFKGVAVGYVRYLSGCNQVLLQPPAKDGEFKDSHWFDEQRCKRVGNQVIILDNGKNPGPDKQAPKR